MLKIILKNKKYIILIYFRTKNILKNNYNYIHKHPLIYYQKLSYTALIKIIMKHSYEDFCPI